VLEPKIIFQDNDILVINKPSGLVVNRAESVKGKTLQDWIENKFSNCQILKLSNCDSKWRSGVVHRLDKDTSGVMIIAKNAKSFIFLQKQFKERKVIKKYICLVHGKVEPREGDIKMPLARTPADRKKFSVRLGGRKAITEYKVLKTYQLPGLYQDSTSGVKQLSLLEINLKTGRTHQIRVHMKHIGYPIVSDPIYLGGKRLKQDQRWCPRLFLHAQYLSFFHPRTGERVEFEAKIPKDLCLKFPEQNRIKCYSKNAIIK